MGTSLIPRWALLLAFSLFTLRESNGLTKQAEFLDKHYRAKWSSPSIDTTNNFDHTINAALLEENFLSNNGSGYSNRVSPQQGLKMADKITKLPGQPPVNFDQYSGYITVDKSNGRAFFYYFTEAPKHMRPEKLPLLLWLNGGPGCSSLAYGAMLELGPFRISSDGKTLFRNRYAWNNAANVLFVESPAGVGFSYSNTTSDMTSNGDRTTAADNYWFLRNWLQRFPEYKDRDIYITGESYAGHYVPQLAHFVLAMNKRVNKDNVINLKGIMIGNAVINYETDQKGMYDFAWTHAVISDEVYQVIQTECDFRPNAYISLKCLNATSQSSIITAFDIYNIYYPTCQEEHLTATPKKASVNHIDPCIEIYVKAYMNRPEVQEAFHANVTKLNYDWETCSGLLYRWTDKATTTIPLIKEFMSNGLRVWIFSGDTDGVVPVASTKYSINTMNLTTTTAWYPWYVDGLVGGFSQVYKGDGELTFATVRGAGHQVPSYQPKRSLSLVTHFLSGKPLPTYEELMHIN